MINVTLRQLQYFEALARHRHFGRAAENCAISQPSLSMQMKELEHTLGAALVERGGRQIRLTEFGEETAQRARAILQAVEELQDFARASRDRLTGRLRIGVIPTVAPYLLPSVIAHLSAAFPDLKVQLREQQTPALIQALGDGSLDTAILALPVSEPSLQETALFEETFLLVRPASERDQPVPEPDKLREMRLLLLGEGHCFRDQALSFCTGGTEPRELLDASALSTLVQMVSAGFGVTLIPEMAAAIETRAAAVAVDRFADPQPKRTIGMVWRRTSPLAGKLDEIAHLVEAAAVHPGYL